MLQYSLAFFQIASIIKSNNVNNISNANNINYVNIANNVNIVNNVNIANNVYSVQDILIYFDIFWYISKVKVLYSSASIVYQILVFFIWLQKL